MNSQITLGIIAKNSWKRLDTTGKTKKLKFFIIKHLIPENRSRKKKHVGEQETSKNRPPKYRHGTVFRLDAADTGREYEPHTNVQAGEPFDWRLEMKQSN